MTKLSLGNIASGYGSTSQLNANFDDIETEFQDNVLYRNNPTGEPNSMHNDLDMNGYRILNAGNLSTMGTTTPFVSLANFDAPNDGLSDASPAMLEALEYLRDNGGGSLYIPQGIYRLDSRVVLTITSTSNTCAIVIFGDDPNTARVLVNNTDGGIKIDCAGKKNPCSISGFSIEPELDGSGTGFEYSRPPRGAGEPRFMFKAENMSFTPVDYATCACAFNLPLKVYGPYRPQITACNFYPGVSATTKATAIIDVSECWNPLIEDCHITAPPKDPTQRKILVASRGNNLATITTETTHSYSLSSSVNVRVNDDPLFNGRFVINSKTATQFSYTLSVSGSNSISHTNSGKTSLGENYWYGGADYGIYYFNSESNPEGFRVRGCNIVGPDTGIYVRKKTRQPQIVIEDNHINTQFYGMILSGVKFGLVCNNLMYNTLLTDDTEDNEDSAEAALATNGGNFTDILLQNCDGLEVINNSFRGSANTLRRHVDMTLDASVTSTPVLRFLHIRNSRLHANTTIAPFYVGAEARSVVIQVPTYVSAVDFVSYPKELVEIDDSATRVQVTFDTSEFGFNVKGWGAAGDGSSNDVTAINNCITAAAVNGGTVFFPSGTYIVTGYSGAQGIQAKSNVTLRGEGRGSAIIKKDLSATAHIIVIDSGISNVTVSGLTIDGNKNTTAYSAHGIGIYGGENINITDVEIKNTTGYGIGIQAGTNKNINIDNVHIHNTNRDGIDIKNVNDDNSAVKISNLLVESWNEDISDTAKAAVDCRGPVLLNNITVRYPGATNATGVRFRNGELLSVNGLGAHQSALNNFHIDLTSATSGICVNVYARDVSVANGYTYNGARGVHVLSSGAKISNVTAESARLTGFSFDTAVDESATGTADNSTLINCFARNGLDQGFITGVANHIRMVGCTAEGNTHEGFFVTSANTQLIGCVAKDNSIGFRTTASATATQIIGGMVLNNTTQVADGGVDTVIRSLGGYYNRKTLQTGNLALDSTGERTSTLTHSLSFTPDISKIQVSIAKQTNVSDFVIAFCRVESVNSSTIIVNAKVTTASATGGAVFRINANIMD